MAKKQGKNRVIIATMLKEIWAVIRQCSLFQEISERAQQNQGDDVPVNRINDFADANVECNPRHNLKSCKVRTEERAMLEEASCSPIRHSLSPFPFTSLAFQWSSSVVERE